MSEGHAPLEGGSSTVRELAKIASELMDFIRETNHGLPVNMVRKIELLCKAVIEYNVLLNG